MLRSSLLLPLLLLPCLLRAQTNTFDNTNEGWRASGDPLSDIPVWQPSGGIPGGYIEVTDASIGGTWYFEAPSIFTGNKCDAYGKFLRYDQFTSDTSNQQVFGGASDVVIQGNSLTLAFDNAQNPGLNWTHYDIPLREDAGWRLGSINGPIPTAQQFQSVLANISAIRIRGEYRALDDFGGLDNFVLESTFRFDLDADDSSGETNGGFNADTVCTPLAKIVDADPVLLSEKRIDSVVIRLPFSPSAVSQVFQPGALPPTLKAQFKAPGWLTLTNAGGASPANFVAALKSIVYRDISPIPTRAVRIASVRVYTECGDMGQRYAYLPIFPTPNAGKNADITVCAQDATADLFNALEGVPETGGFWRPALTAGGSTFQADQDLPGIYRYTIPGAGPCPGDTAAVTVRVEPFFPLRNDTTICAGDSILLYSPPNLINWRWNGAIQRTVLDVRSPGVYTLVGQTKHCPYRDSVRVDVYTCTECPLYAPNVFKPGAHDVNSRWQVFMPCDWQQFHLAVFDRWGNQVFVSRTPEEYWDGTWQGEDLPVGVYIWQMEWTNELYGLPKAYRSNGSVTLLR